MAGKKDASFLLDLFTTDNNSAAHGESSNSLVMDQWTL